MKKNLKKEERESLENLANDKSVIIEEAEKGGAMVIMNTEFYEKINNKHVRKQ